MNPPLLLLTWFTNALTVMLPFCTFIQSKCEHAQHDRIPFETHSDTDAAPFPPLHLHPANASSLLPPAIGPTSAPETLAGMHVVLIPPPCQIFPRPKIF